MNKDFEQLPHTADIKIRVYGKDLAALFRNALIGMFQIVKPKATGCKMKNGRLICSNLPVQHEVEVKAGGLALTLVDFLSEALYLSDVHNEAYLDACIHEIDEHHVKATLYGAPISGFEVVEIKAVTYHDLEVKKVGNLWQAVVVFDI